MNIEKRLEVYGVVDKDTGEVVIDRQREKKDLVDSGVRVFKSEIDEKIEELEAIRTEITNLYEGGEDE